MSDNLEKILLKAIKKETSAFGLNKEQVFNVYYNYKLIKQFNPQNEKELRYKYQILSDIYKLVNK